MSDMIPADCIVELTAAEARRVLDYDPVTGSFHWRFRPELRSAWNARFSSQPAGSVDKRGYRTIRINRKFYYCHRLAWLMVTGVWPSGQIDHINENKSDNKFKNFRIASQSENSCNRGANRANTSGFKGVTKNHSRWMAQIVINRQHIYLGTFDTPADAHAAYREAALNLHGEFANIGDAK